MSTAAAAFTTIDANHDGVIDQAEFAAAVAPAVTYTTGSVSAPANTYVLQPSSVLAPAYTTTTAAPVITYGASTSVLAAPTQKIVTLMPGSRIVYTARSTGEKYPGSVVERNAAGWLIKLDIDGGVKEVVDADMWRVDAEESAAPTEAPSTATPAAAPVKKKKSKSSKKSKGCC